MGLGYNVVMLEGKYFINVTVPRVFSQSVICRRLPEFCNKSVIFPWHKGGMNRYRTIFISDVHLGTPGCQAAFLLDFLRHNDAETIYLIGDIIDGWRLKKSWYWPQEHNDVLQKLLKKAS